MSPSAGNGRALLRSGWLPLAVVVLAFVGMTHRAADVDYRDIVVFLGYLGGWIVFPGTVAWRLVDPRGERRPLGEDLAVGALVGYVLEFPVYLTCLGLGHPHGYLLWPLVPLVVLCLPNARRIRHLGAGRMPTWWSWSAAAAGLYLVAWFGRFVWSTAPNTLDALRRPYIDEPFHLALATGLRHFFPPRVTYVDDTPLDYHFAGHLHVAAASWVTGIEPVILLRTLAFPALIMVTLLAAAFLVVRLTGAAWTGPALLATIAVGPAIYAGWSDSNSVGLISRRLYVSPTAAFVNAALVLGLLLCIELLRKPRRAWGAYALVLLTFVAMSGAKSTSLPTLMAGLALAALVSSVLRRKVDWPAVGLTALAILGFQISRWIFFGAGTHGLGVDPLAITGLWGTAFPGLRGADGELAFGTRAVVAVYVLGYLTLGAGTLAMLARQGWKRADHVFLVTVCAAGIGAGFTFHQTSYSEAYFVYVVALPLMIAAVLGVHHLVEGRPARRATTNGLASLAVGALGAVVFGALADPTLPNSLTGSPVSQAVHVAVVPVLVILGLILALAGAILLGRGLLDRDNPGFPGLALLVVVVTFLGFGAGPVLRSTVPDLVKDPFPTPGTTTAPQLIGKGGLAAGRWLRDHTPPDDVIATNAHCQFPGGTCVARNFWMAGWSERQFLVEGWSYVSRWSVGLKAPADEDVTRAPFWDPDRLAINDRAFHDPTRASVETLRTQYDVRWLLVDTRYRVDLPALMRQADLRYSSGVYRVFELR